MILRTSAFDLYLASSTKSKVQKLTDDRVLTLSAVSHYDLLALIRGWQMELIQVDKTIPLCLCPSAQPRGKDSFIIGVVGGTVQEPRVQYLQEIVPIANNSPILLALIEPTEIFRFAATCSENCCQHFDGSRCRLVSKTVKLLPEVVKGLPSCQIRSNCRWWQQEGKAACKRCPQVVTTLYNPSEQIRKVTDPANQ